MPDIDGKTLLKTLDRPIAFQRAFVAITGSINAALMLSQAVYWTNRTDDPNGWFWKTQDQWEDETGLTRREQDGARKVLREKGFLFEEKRSVPPKIFYRVNAESLQPWHMHQSAKLNAPKRQIECTKPPNCMHETANLYVPKRHSSNTETTAESTAETTGNRPPAQAPASERYDFDANSLDAIPQGLALVQYAAFVLEHCNIPGGYRLRVDVGEAIRLLAKEEKSELAEATRVLALRAKAAIARGETVNSFWVADCKWKQNGEQHAQRSARNASRDNATIDAARRAALSES